VDMQKRKPPINELVEAILPLIQHLTRGDSVAVIDLEGACRQPMKRWDQALRQWFMRERGIRIYRRDGRYHLMTDQQQSEQVPKRHEQARRAVGRGLAEGGCVAVDALDDTNKARHQHQMRVLVTCAESMEASAKRLRFIADSAPKGLYAATD
jgi:hypothetical protein